MLVDGHESRMAHDFLEYINHPDHKWSVNLGVPYCTNLWQTGDSEEEQNGSFKQAWYKAKRELIQFKTALNLPCRLCPQDIMPLVNIAWNKSFARVESNQAAATTQGWYPVNRVLLEHPEVLVLETRRGGQEEIAVVGGEGEAAGEGSSIDPESINLHQGEAGRVMDTILQSYSKNGGTTRIHQQLKQGEEVGADHLAGKKSRLVC